MVSTLVSKPNDNSWCYMRWFREPEKRHQRLIRLYDTQTSLEPLPKLLYQPLKLTGPGKVRVVLMAKEPYRIYGPNVNDGLAWSAQYDAPKIPKPLRNIISEYQDDLGFRKPTWFNLEPWAKNGVLLMYSTWLSQLSPSTKRFYDESEALTWEILYRLNRHQSGIVFMFWGAGFPRWEKIIDRKKHVVLNFSTPTDNIQFDKTDNPLFFGSKCFTECSKLLGVSTNMWRLT